MKNEQRIISGTVSNRRFIHSKGITLTTIIMPFITVAIIWLFTSQVDTLKGLDSLKVKVDVFNKLNAEKTTIQIENIEKNIDTLNDSLTELQKDQKEILKLLIQMKAK